MNERTCLSILRRVCYRSEGLEQPSQDHPSRGQRRKASETMGLFALLILYNRQTSITTIIAFYIRAAGYTTRPRTASTSAQTRCGTVGEIVPFLCAESKGCSHTGCMIHSVHPSQLIISLCASREIDMGRRMRTNVPNGAIVS